MLRACDTRLNPVCACTDVLTSLRTELRCMRACNVCMHTCVHARVHLCMYHVRMHVRICRLPGTVPYGTVHYSTEELFQRKLDELRSGGARICTEILPAPEFFYAEDGGGMSLTASCWHRFSAENTRRIAAYFSSSMFIDYLSAEPPPPFFKIGWAIKVLDGNSTN